MIRLYFVGRERYAPEINKRMRPHLKLAGASYRIDETYVKVGKQWKYLYRAVDSTGQTIEFMLSAKRDVRLPASGRGSFLALCCLAIENCKRELFAA